MNEESGTGSVGWYASVLWLALKIAVILFLMHGGGTAFIYQNF